MQPIQPKSQLAAQLKKPIQPIQSIQPMHFLPTSAGGFRLSVSRKTDVLVYPNVCYTFEKIVRIKFNGLPDHKVFRDFHRLFKLLQPIEFDF